MSIKSSAIRESSAPLYTLDYTFDCKRNPEDDNSDALMAHVKIFIEADFLDIPKLREVAANKFKTKCSNVLPEDPKLLDLVRLVYTQTQGDNELRKVIVDQVAAGDMNGMEELVEE